MNNFLQYVAEDIFRKFGEDLSRTALVFPNKRAALFFNEYLSKQVNHPIWSPAYLTISELFRQHSDLQVADPIKLVCDLHKCYMNKTGFNESLDHFYGWGQLLLADFDDIDKNMAEANKVFANLSDLHELDDVSYLNDEQKAAIRRFFSNFTDNHNTELKKRFLQLWSKIDAIYEDFNNELTLQGLAYEGALYRKVAEQEHINFEYDRYIFVGFNLLQKVEQVLFQKLKQLDKAHFYWDFDHYYMPHNNGAHRINEAGHYISQYLEIFPNELDIHNEEIYNQFSKKKEITFISASTENAQARYINTWLKERQNKQQSYERISDGRNTAIILCNEGLLQSVIHCLPSEVEKVNITIGFPLIQSPVASLISQLVNLQSNGYAEKHGCFRLEQVKIVLRHPYMEYLSDCVPELYKTINEQRLLYLSPNILHQDENLRLLFQHLTNNEAILNWLCEILQKIARQVENDENVSQDLPLVQESIFRMYTLINRMLELTKNGNLHVNIQTMQRLITQITTATSVPFHGEPIEGIQVMGVLETRNLDFDHILLLSCNEGNMPKGVNDTSFIPYNIRKAYGLTTIDHKVAIYSYYFHRLLQRASDITILYNNATTDGVSAEKSRFMLQMMVESSHSFVFKTLQAGQKFNPFIPTSIKKSGEIIKILHQLFDINNSPISNNCAPPLLTPTAINRYMNCQLTFYYNYVCGITQPNDTDSDEIDSRTFGTIFHHAAEIIYKKLMDRNGTIKGEDIEYVLKNEVDIERAVDEAFRADLFHMPYGTTKELMLNGLQLINRQVIIQYLKRLLSIDKRLKRFRILGLEVLTSVRIDTPHISTTIGGRIDRLDQIPDIYPTGSTPVERIRVVDYKTGSKNLKPLEDVEAVFDTQNLSKHSDYYLQAMLYSCNVRTSAEQNPQQLPVSPALLFIQHAGNDNYDPTLYFGKDRINDIKDYQVDFGSRLKDTIDEIFNPNIDFTPTEDKERCTNCPYHLLCKSVLALLICFFSLFGYAKHQILSPNIKTLQVVVNNEWTSMPIMTLGKDDVLHVGFDELSHEYHRYNIHLEHCEVDWTPSDELFDSDWLEGFNDFPIENYEKSFNTTVLYTHYNFTIPNEHCRLKSSGNYRIHILDEGNDNKEIAVAEFRMVTPLVNLRLWGTTNTDLGLNSRFQQIMMSIGYNNLKVTNHEEQLKVFVMQNAREDNMKTDVAPNYITPNGLTWEHNKHLIFDGGNEYHKFEVLDPSHISMGLERVWWDEDNRYFHAFPFVCEPQRNYTFDKDANGSFYIRNSDNYDNDIQSDYVFIHYKLKAIREYENTNIYINGQWTVEDQQQYKMTYNESDQSYNAVILQKMGYYNYQFIMIDPDGISHPLPEEGSFYQTENSYQVLVYYKGISDRTWQLVGFKTCTLPYTRVE